MIPAEQINLATFKLEYFSKFQQLFIQEFGFFFPEDRIENFRKILIKYLKKTPFSNYDDFYTYLTATLPGKILFKQIIEDITIGETYFYRNVPQLDLLKEHIIPDLIQSKKSAGDNTITVWSAGCSTGEEVYTLAIIFLESLPSPQFWDIKIMGTDIKQSALHAAEEGVYRGMRPKKHLPKSILKKYFEIRKNEFFVKDRLREITSFTYHNLVKESPAPINEPDIIFCRNVTIYFHTDTVKSIINSFFDTLQEGGFLFLGHSETIWQICDRFRILDFPKGFVYQKSSGNIGKQYLSMDTPASIPDFNLEKLEQEPPIIHTPTLLEKKILEQEYKPPPPVSHPHDEKLEKLMSLDVRYHQGVQFFEKKKYDAALKCFEEILKQDNRYLLAHFAKATIYSNQGQYDLAMHSLDFLIDSDNLFTEAYFLKSILLIKLHQKEEAIQSLKQVLYIDPDHALAYFHLANLYKESGKNKHAKLAWTNLKRICHTHEETEIVSFSDNLTYETLETIAEKALVDLD